MIGFDLKAVFKSRKQAYSKPEVIRHDVHSSKAESSSRRPLQLSKKASTQSNANFLKITNDLQLRNKSKDQHQTTLSKQLSLKSYINKHIISHVKGTFSSSNFDIQNMAESTKSILRQGRNNKSLSKYDVPKYFIKLGNHGHQSSVMVKPTIKTVFSMNTESSECLQNGIAELGNGLPTNLADAETFERPISIDTSLRQSGLNHSIKSIFSVNMNQMKTQEKFFDLCSYLSSKESSFEILGQPQKQDSFESLLKLIRILKEYIDNQKTVYTKQIRDYSLQIEQLKHDYENSFSRSFSLLKQNTSLKAKTLEIISKLTDAHYRYSNQELELKVSY